METCPHRWAHSPSPERSDAAQVRHTVSQSDRAKLWWEWTHWVDKWRGILCLRDTELRRAWVFLCSQKWLFLGQNNRFNKAYVHVSVCLEKNIIQTWIYTLCTLCVTNTQTYRTKSVLYKWNGTEILSPYHRWRTKTCVKRKVRQTQKTVWWDKAIFMNPLWFSSLHYECWRGHKSNISLTSVGHGMVNMPRPSVSVLSVIGCSWKKNNQDWSERGLQFFVI